MLNAKLRLVSCLFLCYSLHRRTFTNHRKVSSPDHMTPLGHQNGGYSNHAVAVPAISVRYRLAREARLQVQVLLCVPVGKSRSLWQDMFESESKS